MSQQVNLYNPAFERKRDLSSLTGSVLAWSLTLAAVVIVFMAMELRSGRLQRELTQLTSERETTQAEMAKLAGQLAARKPDPALAVEITRLELGVASRREVMSTLHGGVIGDRRGFSAHLQAFARQSFTGLWLTGLTVASAGQDVVLEGRATKPDMVPTYLQRLNGEEIMKGHAFAELEMRRPEAANGAAQIEAQFVEFRLATLPLADSSTKPAIRR